MRSEVLRGRQHENTHDLLAEELSEMPDIASDEMGSPAGQGGEEDRLVFGWQIHR